MWCATPAYRLICLCLTTINGILFGFRKKDYVNTNTFDLKFIFQDVSIILALIDLCSAKVHLLRQLAPLSIYSVSHSVHAVAEHLRQFGLHPKEEAGTIYKVYVHTKEQEHVIS